MTDKQTHTHSPALYRCLPFAVFMGFIGIEEGIRFLAARHFISLSPETLFFLYPIKALTVGSLLLAFRKHYQELRFSDLKRAPETIFSGLFGFLVFILWIQMDWTLPGSGNPPGYNPFLLPGDQSLKVLMTATRIAGAVLVVPVMEELFWRSFLLRYIIDKNFDTIKTGTFTWASFLISSLLFGLEHHYFFAGIMAGAFYNLLLYRTRSIAHCVFAHAITNLVLSAYTVSTGSWHFW